MAAFDHTSTSGVSGRFGNSFTALAARILEWNDKRRTRIALEQLSDRELDDIGLSRADVAAIR